MRDEESQEDVGRQEVYGLIYRQTLSLSSIPTRGHDMITDFRW